MVPAVKCSNNFCYNRWPTIKIFIMAHIHNSGKLELVYKIEVMITLMIQLSQTLK